MDWMQIIDRGETPNIDFKAASKWDGEERARLTKAIAAMANTRDGGTVLVGIDDDRVGGKPKIVGLTAEQLVSFDPTKVADYVNQRFEPAIQLRIEKPEVSGKVLAAIVVKEFEDQPHICVRELSYQGKQLFKPGDLLIRTAAAQSTVAGPQELRDLLGRAVAKKGEHLLEQMRRIVTGVPAGPAVDWRTEFAEELSDWVAIEAESYAEFGKLGAWSFFAIPTAMPPPTVQTHQQLLDAMQKARVSLRGWDFPPTSGFQPVNRANRIDAKLPYAHERWALFRRLLFGDVRPYFEDIGFYGGSDNPRGSILNILNTNQSVGEFVLFSKRLFEAVGYEGTLELQVKLTGCRGRKLVAGPNRFLSGIFQCDEPEIIVRRSAHTTDLAAGWQEHAADIAQDILSLFNMNQPLREAVLNDIATMLARK